MMHVPATIIPQGSYRIKPRGKGYEVQQRVKIRDYGFWKTTERFTWRPETLENSRRDAERWIERELMPAVDYPAQKDNPLENHGAK